MQSFRIHTNEAQALKFYNLLPKKVRHTINRLRNKDKYKAALLMIKHLRSDPDVISRGLTKARIQGIAADHFGLNHREFAKILNRQTRYEAIQEGKIKPEDLFKRDNKALFIKKAKAGEVLNLKGQKINVKLSDKDLAPIISADDLPDTGTQERKDYTNMLKKLGGMGNIDKGLNSFSTASSKKPKGEDWESLIAIGVNIINGEDISKSSEWARAEKFWADYEKPSMKLGQAFIDTFKIKHLEQTGDKTATLSKVWKGKNKTPKTDLLSGKKDKISLKKAGGSQLMSAGKEEAISTFEAAMSMYSISPEGKKTVNQMIDGIEENMNKMSTKGTIGSLEDLRDSGKKLSKADQDRIAEMEGLQDSAKELTTSLDKVFKDDDFKKYFCWEAATGETKFGKGAQAVSNLLVVFTEGGTIKNSLRLDSPKNAGMTIAKKNNFYVSFKSGGSQSRPYLSLRTKGATKKDFIPESFGDIVYDEINKGGLLLEDMEQLNEFQMFDRLARKVKGVSNQIKMQVKKIFDAIMKRMNQAFSYIKGLGEKVMEGLLAFFGLPINNVIVRGGGDFPL